MLVAELEPGFDTTERTLAAIEIHDQFLSVDQTVTDPPPPRRIRNR